MALHVMKSLFLLPACFTLVLSQNTSQEIKFVVWSEITVTPAPKTTTSYTSVVWVAPGSTTYTVISSSVRTTTPSPYVISTQIQVPSSNEAVASTSVSQKSVSETGSTSTPRPPSASASASHSSSDSTSTSHFSTSSISASRSFSEPVVSTSSSKTIPGSTSEPIPVSTSTSASSTSSFTSTISTPTLIGDSDSNRSPPIGIIVAVITIVGLVALGIGLCCWGNRRYKQKHGMTYIQKFKGVHPGNQNVPFRAMNSANNQAIERFRALNGDIKANPYIPETNSMSSTYGLTTMRPRPSAARPLSSQTIAADDFYNINLVTPHSPSWGKTSDSTRIGERDRTSTAGSETGFSPAPLKIIKKEREQPESIWADDTRHSVSSTYDRNTNFFSADIYAPSRTRGRSRHRDSEIDAVYREQDRLDAAARLEGRDPIAERALRELERSRRAKAGGILFNLR